MNRRPRRPERRALPLRYTPHKWYYINNMNLGTLFVVATPIGNLADFSSRGVETLKKVDLILAEDTRVTRKLLTHYEIDKPLVSYHQQSHEAKKEEVLQHLLTGKDLALVTDAGTPGVSDPGNELIDYLTHSTDNLTIIPIPGPSSVTAALSVSGFKASNFLFGGYIPKKKKTRWLESISGLGSTLVYFDSPYRVLKNLEWLKEEWGDIEIFVAREMTKKFESYYRGKISEVIKQIGSKSKGEFVVVVGAPTRNRT